MAEQGEDNSRAAFFVSTLHRAMVRHPWETAEIVSLLARPVRDEDDLVDVLQVTVDIAVRTIDAADHASVTIKHRGQPFTAVHTDPATLAVDRRQYERGDGPCLEAARSGTVVLAHLGADDHRWSAFADDARRAGITSVLAAPVGTGADPLGALNLYGTHDPQLDHPDEVLLDLLVGMTDRCLHPLLAGRTTTTLTEQLREAVAGRVHVEQATGILMATHQVDGTVALTMLREQSRRTGTKLRHVAEHLVGLTSARP